MFTKQAGAYMRKGSGKKCNLPIADIGAMVHRHQQHYVYVAPTWLCGCSDDLIKKKSGITAGQLGSRSYYQEFIRPKCMFDYMVTVY